MTHAEPYLGNDQLYVGDGKRLIISNTTHNILHTLKRTFTLSNILHVPQILSLGFLTRMRINMLL
jgi:Ca2+-binding RTX toxin-like protein